MPANGLIFADAIKERDKITKSELLRIKSLYEKWADEIASEAKKFKGKDGSGSLKERQAKELERMLRKSANITAEEAEKGIKSGLSGISKSVVNCAVDWMEGLGFPKSAIKLAFSNVPDFIIKNIVTGKIYKSGWSLSASIWGDNEDTLSKLYEIIAGGIAENKSVYEISKDIEGYVRPSRKKKWNLRDKDGRLIYPKQVDYNAQRLVRTLSQHAYQQSFIATTKDNPLIEKYVWRSKGHRACEVCKARDGKVYDKDKLPLDHPNGFCIMEILVPNESEINDRLASWVKGGKDKELDKFAKTIGLKASDMLR